VNGQLYDYQIQSSSRGQLTLVVNGQIRHQEYFVEKNVVHVFDHAGDQLGFRFDSD